MERSDGSEVSSLELPAHHHNMPGAVGGQGEVTNKAGIGVMKGRNEPEKAETGEELIDIPVVHISTSSSLSTNTCQAPSGRLFKYFNQSSRNTFVSPAKWGANLSCYVENKSKFYLELLKVCAAQS